MRGGADSAPEDGAEAARARAAWATELVVEIDARGRIAWASPNCRDVFGYEARALIGKRATDFVHPEDRDAAIREFAGALRGPEPAVSVHRARHGDGSWRWFQDRGRAVDTGDGEKRLVVVSRDVSDLKAAEDALSRQLDVQRRVAQLSRLFVGLPADRIDAAVREHLAEAAELADAERTSLIVTDGSGRILGAYEFHAHGTNRCGPHHDDDAHRRYAWATRTLRGGEILHVVDPAQLPDEAAAERADLLARGVRSMLTIPVRAGETVVGYQVYERLTGHRAWTEQELTVLRLVGEIFASAIKRRETEGALRESEARFRAIAEHATELVAELDRDGRYHYASPSFADLLGYDPSELLGRSARTLQHPDDLAGAVRSFREALRRETATRSVHRLRHRDGSWRWFDNSGRAFRTATGDLRFVSIGRDVTERKRMEEAIERQRLVETRIAALSRRFLALDADQIDAAIEEALAEAADLAGAERSYLYPASRSPGDRRPFFEWLSGRVPSYPGEPLPWSTQKMIAGEILQVRRLEDLPAEAEPERLTLAARNVASMLAIPVRSGNRTIGVFGFETCHERCWSDRDITLLRMLGELFTSALRRRRTEDRLRESRSQLLQAQKLEAVGRLAGGIAHDFNNLLTVILGFSRPLLRDLAEGDPVREDVKEIHGAAERAAALTRQLLTFSRRQRVETQVVDLNATVRGLAPLLSRLLGEDVELGMELDRDPGLVAGDPHQFEQVVINLAVNARDAMPDGGTLSLRTQRRRLSAVAARQLGLAGPGGYVCLSVSDSGCGIDDETRTRIFDPFFTTKEPGKGTGLGLSIVYSVVEQAGGAIAVQGRPSKGTTFEILLPRVDGEAAVERPAIEMERTKGQGCVLLVEDEPAVRRLSRRILERSGYRVLEAGDGRAALEVADAHAGSIDGLVTDVVMPKLGGPELARRLRERQPGLGVLFVSGHPRDPEDGSAEPLPPGGFLQKPFTEAQLLQGLRETLGR